MGQRITNTEVPNPDESAAARRSAAVSALHGSDLQASELMIDFADTVLCEVADWPEPDEDTAHEVADGAVPIYNTDRLELISSTPTLWTRTTDLGDGSEDVITLAGYILYDVARELADAALEARREAESDEE